MEAGASSSSESGTQSSIGLLGPAELRVDGLVGVKYGDRAVVEGPGAPGRFAIGETNFFENCGYMTARSLCLFERSLLRNRPAPRSIYPDQGFLTTNLLLELHRY